MDVDTQSLGEWIRLAFFVLGGVLVIIKIIQEFRPQPSLYQRYQSKEACAIRKDNCEQRIAAIEACLQGQNEKTEGWIRGVHKRIDVVLSAVYRMEGKLSNPPNPERNPIC